MPSDLTIPIKQMQTSRHPSIPKVFCSRFRWGRADRCMHPVVTPFTDAAWQTVARTRSAPLAGARRANPTSAEHTARLHIASPIPGGCRPVFARRRPEALHYVICRRDGSAHRAEERRPAAGTDRGAGRFGPEGRPTVRHRAYRMEGVIRQQCLRELQLPTQMCYTITSLRMNSRER